MRVHLAPLLASLPRFAAFIYICSQLSSFNLSESSVVHHFALAVALEQAWFPARWADAGLDPPAHCLSELRRYVATVNGGMHVSTRVRVRLLLS